MITFFTVPKKHDAFRDIERQAMQNWNALPCDKEVLVYDGSVRRTPQGTPLLDDVFAQAAGKSKYDLLVYANADILFTSALPTVLGWVRSRLDRFLVVGQRTDVPFIPLNFDDPRWEDHLQARAKNIGILHPPSGIDWFAFRRESVADFHMPPFAVGRPAWDNWLIHRCLELSYPVVDVTNHVLAVHQNHNFSHLVGGRKESRYGVEAQENIRLAGGKFRTIEDATHHLEDIL